MVKSFQHWPKHEHGNEHNLNFNKDKKVYPFNPPGTPTELIRDCAISGKP